MPSSRASLCSLDWIRRKTWPPTPARPAASVSLADLFCGCGGLTLGVWEAARVQDYALEVKFAIDTCPAAIDVYRTNFGLSERVARQTDIRSIFTGAIGAARRAAERRLLKEVPGVDILVAGPPCQGHSDLNNHTRRNDPRNRLYLKVIRAVELLKPRIVLVENVGPVVHDSGGVIARSLDELRTLGYSATTRMVRVLSLGLPQRRKRHILLALRDTEVDFGAVFPVETKSEIPLERFLADIEDQPNQRSELFYTPSRMTPANARRAAYLFRHDLYDLPNKCRPPCHRNGHSYVSMYGRLRWDQPAQTITTGFGCMGQGRFVHPKRPRVITPHEAARIQGFPDFFDFSRATTRRTLHNMIGNAVPPQIAAEIVGKLLTVL